MLKEERHNHILHQISLHNKILSSSLSEQILASEDTILLDLQQFAQEGEIVKVQGDTTISGLARMVPKDLHASFITVSLSAVTGFTNHPNIEMVIPGDNLSGNSTITVGAEAILKIRQIKPNRWFIGINAIDMPGGLMDKDRDLVQVKRAVINSAKKTIALSISEKINRFEPLKI